MRLAPDDDIYRVRMVYLGPPGWHLPVQWTYGRWALFAVLSVVCAGGVWLLTGAWQAALVAEVGAMFGAALIWRRVDPDRPARTVIRTVATDWRTYRRPDPQPVKLPDRTATHIKIGGLS